MFSGCCCSDAKDHGQLSFQPRAGDEGVACGGDAADVRIPLSAKMTSPPGATEVSPAVAAAHAMDVPATSARSLTEQEREEEKARIQDMVNRFAKNALVGCPCICVREGSGERVETKYRLDKTLEHMVILSVRGSERAEITCPIADIQDIYSYVEDGEACFPPAVLSALRPEEAPLLLMVVFHAEHGRVLRFCLLEQCNDSRDMFLECLRILCIYASSARSRRARA
mmetsp:Transcript_9228/g.29298  ORF Transcript_9228/g.29298 Transcript_9228/m.29298 type:complete len:226 (-) Transcript_9228:42-719(-)